VGIGKTKGRRYRYRYRFSLPQEMEFGGTWANRRISRIPENPENITGRKAEGEVGGQAEDR
jgi:hypothetical protein